MVGQRYYSEVEKNNPTPSIQKLNLIQNGRI